MFSAHTVKMVVDGVGNWESWSTTCVKSTTLVSLEGDIAGEEPFSPHAVTGMVYVSVVVESHNCS